MRILDEAKNPVFLCSFGKDSSCILHWLKESGHIDKTTVVFIDCGGLYPDIMEWAKTEGGKLPKFEYITTPGDIWKEIREKGFAVDVEISELGAFSDLFLDHPLAGKYKIRDWKHCMNDRVWKPLQIIMEIMKPDLVITGERRQDRPYAEDWERRNFGTRLVRPIFDWTDEQVWSYIDKHGIPLAKTFQGRQKDRRDCWLCLGGHDFTPGRMAEFKRDWPDLHHKLFVEEGFGEVLPAMIELTLEKLNTLQAVAEVSCVSRG